MHSSCWKTLLKLVLATVTAVQQISHVDALYNKGSAVKQINAFQFDEVVYKSNGVVLVEFYAPWCGHCKQLAPEYNKAAKKLKNQVTVVAIDCDAEANKQLCGMQEVRGFPTIKLFYPLQNKNKGKDKGKSKTSKKAVIRKGSADYQGERKAEAIVEAALNRLPNWSTTLLTSEKSTIARANIELFLKDEDTFRNNLPKGLPKILLLTDKPKVAPLIQALALDFYGRVRVGVARDKKLIKRYNAKKMPTLLALPNDTEESSDEPIVYQDKFVYSKMREFFEEHATTGKSTKKVKKETTKKDNEVPSSNKAQSDDEMTQDTSEDSKRQQAVIAVESQADLDRCLDGPEFACILVLLDKVDPNDEEQVKADKQYLDILETALEKDRKADGPFEFAYLRAPNDGLIAKRLDLPTRRPMAIAIEWRTRLYSILEEDQSFTLENIQIMQVLLVSKRGDNLQPLALRPEFGPTSVPKKKKKKESQKKETEHDEL
ncbi:thioredoxin-domain-containing protein [Syncephalis plumigaleata]|nr:thioredoxin-domain-containing protein [Syncephalis plumigaleata]